MARRKTTKQGIRDTLDAIAMGRALEPRLGRPRRARRQSAGNLRERSTSVPASRVPGSRGRPPS